MSSQHDTSIHQAIKALLEEFNGDIRIFEHMLRVFFRESQEAMDALNAAAAANDFPALAHAAHKLRGTASNFQPTRLMQSTSTLEDEARRKALADPLMAVRQIEIQLQELCDLLRRESLQLSEGNTHG